MRKIFLIAAMALISASAQAGDSRSLSTGLGTMTPIDPPTTPVSTQRTRSENDTPAAATAPRKTETPRYSVPTSEIKQQPAERSISEEPRYARPAPVDNTPPATASTNPSTTAAPVDTDTTATTPPAVTTRPSIARQQPENDESSYRPSRRRYANADRQYGARPYSGRSYGGRGYGRGYGGWPHYRARLTAGRIIAALHRYGIYW